MTEHPCPHCGADAMFRLGAYECPSCNWMGQPAQAATPLDIEGFRRAARASAVTGIAKQPLPMMAERWLRGQREST